MRTFIASLTMLILLVLPERSRGAFTYTTSTDATDFITDDSDSHQNAQSKSSINDGHSSASAVATSFFTPDSGDAPKIGVHADATAGDLPTFNVASARAKVTSTDLLHPFWGLPGGYRPTLRDLVETVAIDGAFKDPTPANPSAALTVQITSDVHFSDPFGQYADVQKYAYTYHVTDGPSPYRIRLQHDLLGKNPALTNFSSWTLTLTVEADVTAGYGATAEAEFTHTVQLSDLAFYDASGNVIPGIGVAGDSGAYYPVTDGVPEPASLPLLGMAAMGLRRRRRMRA